MRTTKSNGLSENNSEMNIKPYYGHVSAPMLALLLQADPDKKAIAKYITTATILVAMDDAKIIGIAAMTTQGVEFELINLAVLAQYQGKGIAKQLIFKVISIAQNRQAQALIVATGNSSLSQLALYQKCGFRLDHIVSDFFADYPQVMIENGIRCIDKVVLKMPF